MLKSISAIVIFSQWTLTFIANFSTIFSVSLYYLYQFISYSVLIWLFNVKVPRCSFNFHFTPDDGLWFRPKYRISSYITLFIQPPPRPTSKGPLTPATKSGDIARRLVAGDKFIAATSLSDISVTFASRWATSYRRYKSLSD